MSGPDAGPRVRLADLIIPVAAVAYAIYYIVSVSGFPFEARLFGLVLGTLLFVLCTLYFCRFAFAGWRRGVETGGRELFGYGLIAPKRLVFLGLIVLWAVFAPVGGFTLTTFLFLTASFLLLGVRPWTRSVAVAAAVAIGGWLFFIVLLGTRFPPGPFETLMARVL